MNNSKHLLILVGPPGCGKSTIAKSLVEQHPDIVRVSQDDDGKKGHWDKFQEALDAGKGIVVDRMNFDVLQRERYIQEARLRGYHTNITVIHQNMETCLYRIARRPEHPTIKDELDAKHALNFFFSKYVRPTESEADVVMFTYPDGPKLEAVICDLDGTLCNIDHRLHFLKPPKAPLEPIYSMGSVKPVDMVEGKAPPFKKDWRSFSESCVTDTINEWCRQTVLAFAARDLKVVFASGRSDEYRPHTQDWLDDKGLGFAPLHMRLRNDYRQDCIVKENILDFEILTRYKPLLFIDDRKQVTDMWRRRGFVCLQCAEGEF